MANSLRGEVLALYKNLLYLGRDYPKGADYFKRHLKNVFLKNKDVKDPEKIKVLIALGEFVMKELLALYFLRKYGVSEWDDPMLQGFQRKR
uniref:Complex 1 LYR protein domain-containing protein n=1 Tax=Cricetulus griseus TaxID=10029 RepID=A0A8C2LJ25_CRIGR